MASSLDRRTKADHTAILQPTTVVVEITERVVTHKPTWRSICVGVVDFVVKIVILESIVVANIVVVPTFIQKPHLRPPKRADTYANFVLVDTLGQNNLLQEKLLALPLREGLYNLSIRLSTTCAEPTPATAITSARVISRLTVFICLLFFIVFSGLGLLGVCGPTCNYLTKPYFFLREFREFREVRDLLL